MRNILIFHIAFCCFANKWIESNVISNLLNGSEAVDHSVKEISVINPAKDLAELIFVHTLWRHGDRGPMNLYPNDPYNESTWHYGLSELTEIGMKQMFKVGKRFHQRYINCTPSFLSENYCNKEIYIRSTDVNRTIVSAMAVLAGMFSNGIAGKDYPEESDELSWPRGWIPIPIHTVELQRDHVGFPFYHCAQAHIMEKEGYQSDDFRNTSAKYKDLLAFLSNVTGYRNLKFDKRFIFILDALNVERFHNLKLPEWFTEKIENEMKAASIESRKYRFGNAKYFGSSSRLIRLRGGAILKNIVDKLLRKWDCLTNSSSECHWHKRIKFFGLSAHDITITALLTALGIDSENAYFPQYGATVYFELYRYSDQPYIKLFYASVYSDEPKSITHLLRGCLPTSDLCPLNNFVTENRNYFPENIKKECHWE